MNKSLREQLTVARSKIRTQIDELGIAARGGDWYGFGGNKRKALIGMLKAQLQEINEALAGLGPDDPQDADPN